MGEPDAAARAAGYEVTAVVRMTHRGKALLELPGEGEPVPWPAGEIAAALGVTAAQLPGMRVKMTVRETPEDGRVLSGFRSLRE